MVRGSIARVAGNCRAGDHIRDCAMFTGPRPFHPRLGLALVAAALGFPFAGHAQTSPPAGVVGTGGGPACGYAPSDPVMAKWTDTGGAGGRLGCPTAREAASPPSPVGTRSREMTFGGGAILWHASGPRAGQTFAISGCVYRLYFQYGGPAGWLGLPTSDAVNTPDGQHQTFEGGFMDYQRAPEGCAATPSAPSATAAATPTAAGGATPATAALDLFFDAARGDYLVAASAASANRALAAHYQRLRTAAYVFTDQPAGTTPLKLYWNDAQGAHVAVATSDGERDALAAGDAFEGVQGFIYTDPRPGAAPLKQFVNAASQHSRLTASPEDEAQATADGYAFVRIEGYAPTAP